MDQRKRTFWILFLGAAAILALIPEFFEEATEEVAVQPAEVRPGGPAAQPVQRGPLAELRSADAPDQDAASRAGTGLLAAARSEILRSDLFASHSWYVPPPVQPAPPPMAPPPPPPPPPPSAPPLPFEFFGKLDTGERLRVFLTRGERVFTVGVGDVIEDTYRVQSIGDTEMVFIYIPLEISQTLSVGSKL